MNQANPQELNIKVANVFTGKAEGEQVPTEKGNCPDATEQKGVRFSQPSINTQSYMHALGFEAYFPNTHRSSSTHTTATTTICSECQSWEGSESSPMIFQTDTPGHCHGGRGGSSGFLSHHPPPP